MIFFITVLRALGAILITNAHYVGVYPTDLIANGGLLGDVIFFAVSGFCLAEIKQTFPSWYGKKVIRIYPAVWIITGVYILLGFYTLEQWTLKEYFLYPTYYHFVASIMILYIPFYIIIKNQILSTNLPKVMGGIFIIQMIIYMLWYDKTRYHIDVVREPMIRFLFFQAMLLGAYFRKYNKNTINKNNLRDWVIMFSALIIYFASKLLFIKVGEISSYQIINQVILFLTLYYIFKCFAGIDDKLERLPSCIKNLIQLIAKITLEIYLVQYVIIPPLAHLVFPLNWIIITVLIIVSAYVLNKMSIKIVNSINEMFVNKSIFSIANKRNS